MHGLLLIPAIQVSVADLSEWARPAVFALAALASVWVFRDARRRLEFGAASVWAWALLTLTFPPAALPLYLAARLYTRRTGAEDDSTEKAAAATGTTDEAEREGEKESVEGVETRVTAEGPRARQRFTPTLLYAATLALAGAAYFSADYRSFDARLARAERAKLNGQPEEAMREYRAALRLREDAHARQLLGLELLQAGRAADALAEFDAAGRAADPDETLPFHAAAALEALGRGAEAVAEYRRFLAGPLCARARAEARCATADARLRALESPPP